MWTSNHKPYSSFALSSLRCVSNHVIRIVSNCSSNFSTVGQRPFDFDIFASFITSRFCQKVGSGRMFQYRTLPFGKFSPVNYMWTKSTDTVPVYNSPVDRSSGKRSLQNVKCNSKPHLSRQQLSSTQQSCRRHRTASKRSPHTSQADKELRTMRKRTKVQRPKRCGSCQFITPDAFQEYFGLGRCTRWGIRVEGTSPSCEWRITADLDEVNRRAIIAWEEESRAYSKKHHEKKDPTTRSLPHLQGNLFKETRMD